MIRRWLFLCATSGSKMVLLSWWEDATVSGMQDTAQVDDPTSREREPGIRRFETEGDECS